MADRQQRHLIADLRQGRNQVDPPWAIRDTECVDAVNVDYYKSRLGNKRGGLSDPAFTSTAPTGIISSAARHVPSTSEAAAELWLTDDAATPNIKRIAGGTAYSAPTLKDVPTGNGWDFTYASINGKLFIAYKSAVDRLHCWDGSTVRRTGLAATGAPTVANQGGGTYAATLRYYRERSIVQSGGVTIRRSEPSSYASITPDAAHASVRITQATVINEGETHWEVEASTDSFTFYVIATVAIGTTFYDDSAATSSYSSNPLSDLTGKYGLQKSYKFIASDQNRLLGFGSYTTTDKQNRIEISAVIGSADVSDEERVDSSAVNSYIDLDENDSGVATGLAGPIFGDYFAFKDRQIWQLTPTGSTDQPYRQSALSKSIGAIRHYAITRAEDAIGNAALYWKSHRGPYRWSINGLEYLGKGCEDYVLGGNATINLAATNVVAVAVYHADKRQVWFWFATGSSNDPNQGFIYDVLTGGWTRVPSSDKWANVRCAVMFANTMGASMSRDLKPYLGQTGGNNRIYKADTGTTDVNTAYRAYVLTKAQEPGGPGFYGAIGDSYLLGQSSTGVTITDSITADFGVQTSTGIASLTPSAKAETRVSVPLAGSALEGDVRFVQHQIGDAIAVSNTWNLDRLITLHSQRGAVTT